MHGNHFMMSIKPFSKIVKFMVPGSGVKALGRGKCCHIVTVYRFKICTITVVGNEVLHCYYVKIVLMLNGEIRRPWAMGQKLKRGAGVVNMTMYWTCIFIYAVCHPLTILTSSSKLHDKLSNWYTPYVRKFTLL